MRDEYSDGFRDGRNKEADQVDRMYAAARNQENALYDDIARSAGIIEQQREQIATLVAALQGCIEALEMAGGDGRFPATLAEAREALKAAGVTE